MQMMDAADRGRYISCLEIAAKMKKEGVSPDYSTYSALIRAAARESAWLDAWAIFDDMLLLGFKPTTAIFNHLLHVCDTSFAVPLALMFQKAQRHRSSLSLWPVIRKMNEMNIAPNSSTFSYIIHRYTSDNNLEVALQYLYAMKAHKLVPELPAIEAVVTLAAHRGYPRLAIDLATWFEDSSIRRLDHAVWMSCLRSSTDSLYVSLRCETIFLFRSNDYMFGRSMAYFTVGKSLFKILTSPQMKVYAYWFSILPAVTVFPTWLRMSFEFLNS